MATKSKIIGMSRISPNEEHVLHEEILPETAPSIQLASEMQQQNNAIDDEFADQDWDIYDIQVDQPSRLSAMKWAIMPSLLSLTFIAWTGFFVWTYRAAFTPVISNGQIIELIGKWAIPTALIAAIWLITQRNSRAEARRFGNIAQSLRTESDALEIKMRTVNEEITLAREFLAQNARELETLGRQSATRLVDAAETLTSALADSDVKAKQLESVSNAATSNLEQLRKQLPVVTSAAKDVTNQIGNAGNAAQMQAQSLAVALLNIGDSSENARGKISAMHSQATDAAEKIDTMIAQSSASLGQHMDDAEKRTQNVTSLLTDKTESAAAIIDTTSQKIDTMLTKGAHGLQTRIDAMSDALTDLNQQSLSQDERVNLMVSRVRDHIEQCALRISEIDQLATDRSAKLAFSFEALAASSKDLNSTLAENHSKADNLLASSERILLALDSAGREIDETLPAALARVDAHFTRTLSHLEHAQSKTALIEESSDSILSRTATVQKLLEMQHQAMTALLSDHDDKFDDRQAQFETLSKAFAHTKSILDDLRGNTADDLLKSLHQVQSSTELAAAESRRILTEELGQIAYQMSEQNRDILASAVDQQVQSLDIMLQSSLERNLHASDVATQKLSAQLAHIDEMTHNLEARLSTAHAGFSGLDDEGFSRRMALLTESLNSTAIDVAKILSNEVTDTAWAAYLKGDRGVFTRRAVRLLDAGEARAIATHYGEEPEFREHVNRYIHDFEAMMRVLLSARDGNAIGVTLLSSDVGKLYVALAQAIERLRN